MEKFVQERCLPADAIFSKQLGTDPKVRFSTVPKILDVLKAEARQQGLWNLFLAKGHYAEGGGYSNLEYALMAEQLGQSYIASEVMHSDLFNASSAMFKA